MKRYLLWASIGAAIGSVVAIFIYPIWQAWIFAFQTLIAGFFAVGAAFITVRQMQASDWKSEKRHNELMELSLRADRAKVARSFFPGHMQLGNLRLAAEALCTSLEAIIPDKTSYVAARFDSLRNHADGATGIWQNPQITEAASLFDGNMADAKIEALYWIDALGKVADRGRAEFDKFGNLPPDADDSHYNSIRTCLEHAMHALNQIEAHTRTFTTGLRVLADDYGVSTNAIDHLMHRTKRK
ncbi:hypothetical protein ELH39_16395 [Rhizobium ruizarguesonis]|uniref:hypothetical protein n=1 Tax=Rhizobium ruizarguesonis TaxID=2081791 RepID=UPI001030A0BC|nr:hypothetical protein [Rhizobium ruizarguesonis]TBA43812.1 hypothetical protein ELH62_16155 [Rhizobium ruizarguesonis]TBB98738.1 hypothetical protein ELH39_16395 [Rhizobium ruizarguesonis]